MSLITIPAKDLWKYIGEAGTILIDLRSEKDFKKGHIEGAINIPYEENEELHVNIEKKNSLILYCERGNLSLQVGRILSKKGYNVISVYGGIRSYRGKLSVDE